MTTINYTILYVTILVGVGTYLIRGISLSLGSRIQFPSWARDWLSFVTPAVLGALLGPSLLLNHGSLFFSIKNAFLLAAIPTLCVAWKTKNLLWTVLSGLVAFGIITHIIR